MSLESEVWSRESKVVRPQTTSRANQTSRYVIPYSLLPTPYFLLPTSYFPIASCTPARMNCVATAASSSPMIRVITLIPVWPR